MKVLITGFDPFGGKSVNPAYEAVKLLPDTINDVQIIKAEIPTVYGKAGATVEALIEENHPDIVICVGQAGGRAKITIEKVAINLAEASIKDNEGNQPMDQPIKQDGANAYFTNLPCKAVVEALNLEDIPAGISYTAGTFVCNDVMYQLLYLIDRKYHTIRGGFIHVPYADEQVSNKAEGTPSMSIKTIARGLEIAIQAIIDNTKDIPLHMGTIQ